MILSQTALQMQLSYQLLAIASEVRATDRLIQLLELLSTHVGSETTKGRRLNVYFTHKDLASAIATTRVTVTRILGEFREKGLITIDRDRHITLSRSRSAEVKQTINKQQV